MTLIPEKNKAKEHLGYLDSMRGIAALMVMAYHFINWKYDNRIEAKTASILFNGSDAVSFFFVLSGFVLSYQYIVIQRPLDFRKFYINRVFRLWPAFFFTVFINALNWNRTNITLHMLADVFLRNKTQFWEEAVLFRTYPQYYVPGWTLVIELSISLFVPFLIILARTNRKLIIWICFCILLIGKNMGEWYMFNFHFALGVLLSCFYFELQDNSFRLTKWYRYRHLILSAAFLLYSVRHIAGIFPPGARYTYIANYVGIDFFHFTGLASFIFIAAILCSPAAKAFLQNKLLRFLGKISYGIYLMHWLLVTDVFIYWDKLAAIFPGTKSAFIGLFFIYSAATILLAIITHYLIELPFMRLGKRLTAKMKPSVY